MYQVRELAEKEGEGGVFQLLRQDVTRFLTTILIGTTYGLLHLVQFYALAIIVFCPEYDNAKCQFCHKYFKRIPLKLFICCSCHIADRHLSMILFIQTGLST